MVPPEAAAENWSSAISTFQAPLPTGMPDSVASYCASRWPWAEAESGAIATITAKIRDKAHRLPTTCPAPRPSQGKMMLKTVTSGRSCITRSGNVI